MNEEQIKALQAAFALAAKQLAQATGLTETEVTAMLNENKETDLQAKVNSRLATQFNDGKDTGLKEGSAKVRGQLDAALKKKNITVNFGEFGDDFLGGLEAEFAKLLKVEPKTSEEVAKLKSQVEELKTNLANAENKATVAKTEAEKEFGTKLDKKLRRLDVEKLLIAQLEEHKAIVPTDAVVAQKRLDAFLRQLDNYDDFEYDEALKDFRLKNDKGELFRDTSTNLPLTLIKNVTKDLISTYYDISEADPKGGGSIDPAKGGGGGQFNFQHFKGTPPKDKTEYVKLLGNEDLGTDALTEVKTYFNTVVAPQPSN
jgi:hypothetical protein